MGYPERTDKSGRSVSGTAQRPTHGMLWTHGTEINDILLPFLAK